MTEEPRSATAKPRRFTSPAWTFIATFVTSVIGSVVAVYALGPLLGAPSFRLVRTKMLVVESDDSDAQIMLSTKFGEAPAFFSGADGNNTISVNATPKGYAIIDISSPDGRGVLSLDTAREGFRPGIRLADPATGAIAWSVTVSEDGTPVLKSLAPPAGP